MCTCGSGIKRVISPRACPFRPQLRAISGSSPSSSLARIPTRTPFRRTAVVAGVVFRRMPLAQGRHRGRRHPLRPWLRRALRMGTILRRSDALGSVRGRQIQPPAPRASRWWCQPHHRRQHLRKDEGLVSHHPLVSNRHHRRIHPRSFSNKHHLFQRRHTRSHLAQRTET